MSSIGVTEILLIATIFFVFAVVFVLIPYWRIFKKAGFSPALSLLMLVPFANIALLYWFAFADWPSLKQGEQTKDVGSPVA